MPDAHAQATQALEEESRYRFASFSASDAVTLGLSIRKRFRASHRHAKGKGLVISIQTIAGHTLFACTVGDLGHASGIGDVGLDSWAVAHGLIEVVRRTGHSSFYVEKALNALGKPAKELGLDSDAKVVGGAFPIWLDNAPCCPIAIVSCYSGSSQDDHNLVVTTVRDFISKLMRTSGSAGMPAPSVAPSNGQSVPVVPIHDNHEGWLPEPTSPQNSQFSPQNSQFSPRNSYVPQGQYTPQGGAQYTPQSAQYTPPGGAQYTPQGGAQYTPQGGAQYTPQSQHSGTEYDHSD
ncbi:hypothetical protein GGG16DRAFT_113764 [Schizophyllum commune]